MERFIRPMAPGWFASVMGTAVTSLALTLASHAAADAGPALAAPVALAASALHWLAIAMMSVLGIAAVYRLIRHGDAVMEQLRHPVEGSFYATFPIAMLVMAAVWTIRGVSPALIAPLWWLVLAVSMTIRNRRQGKLPFALSWWAFVFPIGACSVLAYRVSELLALEVLPLVASGLTLLALFVWSATALGTVRGIRTGAIFAPAH